MTVGSSAPNAPGGIGDSVPKRDGTALVRGRIRYVDDNNPAGLLHASVVRSTVAHGRIRSIDPTAAKAHAGVVTVLTGAQAAESTEPIPYFIDPASRGGRRVDLRCLEPDLVTYVGQPVAAVVARTRSQARAAARLVAVEYDLLPHVLSAADAVLDEAPRVYPQWPDNIIFSKVYGTGDPDSRLAEADVSITAEFETARSNTAPMEPRGYIAAWDDVEQRLTVTGSLQNPHQLRWMLAQTLRLEETSIRVITSKVGGSFGLKMQGLPEETLVCLLSMLLHAPVKWIEDRSETFLSGAREQRHRITLGANRDGTVVALKNEILVDGGSLTAQAGWAMCNMSASTFPSGYRVQDCRIELLLATTNKPPLSAARGFGKDSAHFVMERAMDILARKLGMDPAELRRNNFIAPDEFPYRTSTGLNIDSGDFAGLLTKAQDSIGYSDWRARQSAGRAEGGVSKSRIGIGIAFEVTPESSDSPGSFVSGYDTTTVRMANSGRVTVLTGVTSPGGGNDTGIAQIVASELGVPLDWIDVVQGDTDRCPNGFGNFSGRSMVVGGGSAALAARDVRDSLCIVGARLLGVPTEACEIANGAIRVIDDHQRQVDVAAVATTVITRAFAEADGVEPRLESTRAYKPGNINHTPDEHGRIQPYPTYSSCLHIAVVDVDDQTGKVDVKDYVIAHDCGTMINPHLVEGQARGAVVMGLGTALTEQLLFDEEGRLLTDRFKTYLLLRASEVPALRMAHQVTPSPFTMHGNKGAGEAGLGGAQAAIANAVEDALSDLDVRVDRLPLTPPRVLDLIDRGRSR